MKKKKLFFFFKTLDKKTRFFLQHYPHLWNVLLYLHGVQFFPEAQNEILCLVGVGVGAQPLHGHNELLKLNGNKQLVIAKTK